MMVLASAPLVSIDCVWINVTIQLQVKLMLNTQTGYDKMKGDQYSFVPCEYTPLVSNNVKLMRNE